MLKSIYLFLVSIFVLTHFTNCVTDCKNERIGEIEPPERYYDFSVYDDKELVIFENKDGETITFRVDTIQMFHRINIEENGVASDPVNGSFSCFKYKTVPSTITQLVGINGKNNLQLQMIPIGESEMDLEYEVQIEGGSNDSISNELISSWASIRYNFTRDVFKSDESMVLYPPGILNEWRGAYGKVFFNVINMTSQDAEVFFVEKIGFVGLRRVDGELFSLKQ